MGGVRGRPILATEGRIVIITGPATLIRMRPGEMAAAGVIIIIIRRFVLTTGAGRLFIIHRGIADEAEWLMAMR
jgi:hypothetical protein